ncbi:MAG: hypothetical protein GWP03_05695 [Proteobacteria bacterium]|nr:hypothetical protein [Pseudomonadota bacterium]
MKKLLLFSLLVIFVLSSCSLFNPSSVPQTAVVTVSGIESGQTTTNRVISVSGTVHNPDNSATTFSGYINLVLNSTQYEMSVTSAGDNEFQFNHDVVIVNGRNELQVKVYNSDSVLVEESPIYVIIGDLPTYPFRVELTWNTDYNDVDLHAYYIPQGDTTWTQHCWYSDKSGITNAFLDVDDVDGFGPENFTIVTEHPGTYKMALRYFSAHSVTSDVTCTVKIYKNENLVSTQTHVFSESQANGDDASNDWYFYDYTVQ